MTSVEVTVAISCFLVRLYQMSILELFHNNPSRASMDSSHYPNLPSTWQTQKPVEAAPCTIDH